MKICCRKFHTSIMIWQYCVSHEFCKAVPKENMWRITPTRGYRTSLAHSKKTEGVDSSQIVSAKQIWAKQKVQAAANLPQLKLSLNVGWGVVPDTLLMSEKSIPEINLRRRYWSCDIVSLFLYSRWCSGLRMQISWGLILHRARNRLKTCMLYTSRSLQGRYSFQIVYAPSVPKSLGP